ncbi:AraC family transcriptional regulator [Bacillus sp. FJAT-49705]|uniref:AraC family transcriptional regulator n=1 Tax=Cytobacillus citreus TaxID=2833586 RepID=A0ABS5NPJ2_9BACI|nr:AraC family transcriptional regulator [Cytobacillus citreus]MBS4189720.1 AraC family transcriptional regulator [Cytobacillus citreus]
MKKKVLIFSEDERLLQKIENVNTYLHSPFSFERIHTLTPSITPEVVAVFFDMDLAEEKAVTRFIQSHRNLYSIMIKEHFQHDEIRRFFKNGAFDCFKLPLNEEGLYKLFQEIIKGERNVPFQSTPLSNDQLEPIKDELKMSLAYDLIYGNTKHSKVIWDRSQLAGLSAIPDTCMVVCVDDYRRLTENKSELWGQSIRNDIIVSVKSYFDSSQVKEMIVIMNGPENIVVLMSLPVQNHLQEYKALSSGHALKLKEYIQESTGYSMTIGIGNYYEDARNLHVSYQEALQAVANKFFTGSNAVIHIEDVEPFTNNVDLLQMNEMAVMANQLTMGDFEGVKSSLAAVLRWIFSQRNISPRLFRLQTLDLLSTLSRAAINGGVQPKEILTMQLSYAKELLLLENLEQICLWFDKVVHQFLEMVLSNHNESMLKSVQMALGYINRHFTEEITLESVAMEVHLSPNYFSNIFKKTTGSSFIEYLTQLRMEKAKLMLMDLNCTVYQIAETVGYSTSRYFSRVFKSYSGMTPKRIS